MLQVTIQNSWIMDTFRIHQNYHDFKYVYFDRILSKVVQQSNADFKQDLIVLFEDNHYSNVDCLDYKRLYSILSTMFLSVKFISCNPLDHINAPDYFEFAGAVEKTLLHFIKVTTSSRYTSVDITNKKMFGLHIQRPDLARLGILIELYRRNLLDYVDCRIGFDRATITATESRRCSNFDAACVDFNIGAKELLNLIDYLPKGDRLYLTDNGIYIGNDMAEKDAEKNQLNLNFAIDIVCESSITDNVIMLTEKTVRPLLLKQPFILIAPQYHYDILHYYNINTFSNLWDETWDFLPASFLIDKINIIGQTCQNIVNNYTIADVITQTQEIVSNNYNTFINNIKTVNHTQLYIDWFNQFIVPGDVA